MGDEANIPAFKLGHTGLARIFGELEAQIMDVIWRLEEATVGDVVTHLEGDYHYNTIMTVMNRLVDKGFLVRRREGRAYIYSAVEDREAFLARVSRQVAEGLLRDFGRLAIAQFVDAADAIDPDLLDELRRLAGQKPEEGEA
ncbi:MAG TPA: BlaI/MecI/CopY family transcriptional regulator [Caldilineae bacterium]|jgi:predicted transcriptional regulator|nr:BlaI/MecI/CopY family transcriptional regulator [Caldilineae bacterium]